MTSSEAHPPIQETEILERLKPILAEVLGVDPGKITSSSGLVADLGAESIDLLDLSFRIEEQFKVTIQADEIERAAMKRVRGPLYDASGSFTEEARAELRDALPDVDPAKIGPGLRKSNLPSLLTVGFFVRLVARKLAERSAEVRHA